MTKRKYTKHMAAELVSAKRRVAGRAGRRKSPWFQRPMVNTDRARDAFAKGKRS